MSFLEQGGVFVVAFGAIVTVVWQLLKPSVTSFGDRLIKAIDHNSARTDASIAVQQDTREEVIAMSSRLDALVSIDERDERRRDQTPVTQPHRMPRSVSSVTPIRGAPQRSNDDDNE